MELHQVISLIETFRQRGKDKRMPLEHDGGIFRACRDAALDAGFSLRLSKHKVNIKKRNRATLPMRHGPDGEVERPLVMRRAIHRSIEESDRARALAKRTTVRKIEGRLWYEGNGEPPGPIRLSGARGLIDVIPSPAVPPGTGYLIPINDETLSGARYIGQQVDDELDAERLAAAINAPPRLRGAQATTIVIDEASGIMPGDWVSIGGGRVDAGALFGIDASSYSLWAGPYMWPVDLLFAELNEPSIKSTGTPRRPGPGLLDSLSVGYRVVARDRRTLTLAYDPPAARGIVIASARRPGKSEMVERELRNEATQSSRVPRHVARHQPRLDGRRR